MQTSLDRYIEIPQDGTWVRVAGSTVTIAAIAQRHLHGHMPLTVIALIDELPLAAIHAAMAFYYDHHAQIDAQIVALAAQLQPTWSTLQSTLRQSLVESGLDSPEKILDLIQTVKLEILAEKDGAQIPAI